MNQMLEFARRPAFIISFSIMIVGLLRIAVISIAGTVKAVRNAGDKNIPYRALIKETFSWIIPFRQILTTRAAFSIISFVFHIGLIIVPLFLLDHILLWRQAGFSWPAIPKHLADTLTFISIITGVILLLNRMLHPNTRFLSTSLDYILMLLILAIFISGFIASRSFNPFSYEATMLVHVLCGNCVLVLIPFTKLAHCLLYPLVRIASNIAWRFPPHAGEAVNKTLYGEEIRKI